MQKLKAKIDGLRSSPGASFYIGIALAASGAIFAVIVLFAVPAIQGTPQSTPVPYLPLVVIEPTVAVGTYTYTSTTDLTGAWITLSPVGAAMTFEITALGVTHTVVTGGTTGHIVVGIADTVTPVYIKCYATAGGTVARNYVLWVTYP